MQFGISSPMSGPMATPETLTRLAVEGEAMGYHYMTFSDHVVIPNDIQARYPYSESGEFPQGSRGGRHEQLITVAYVAGKTSRLKLVLSVMVVPHRPAVLAAKMLSTIDVLSDGRLIVGIGAGWMREEFEAVAAPDFSQRGAVTDEFIDAFRELWTAENPKFAGKHVKFADIVFEPKPVQKPHPPIWVGGESGPALRRTARVGDAWYPIGTNPQNLLDSLPRLKANIARLRKMTQDSGRDPTRLGVAYSAGRYGSELPANASDGERRLFSGATQDIIDDIRALQSLGVGYVNFGFAGADADSTLAEMKRFHNEVLARV